MSTPNTNTRWRFAPRPHGWRSLRRWPAAPCAVLLVACGLMVRPAVAAVPSTSQGVVATAVATNSAPSASRTPAPCARLRAAQARAARRAGADVRFARRYRLQARRSRGAARQRLLRRASRYRAASRANRRRALRFRALARSACAAKKPSLPSSTTGAGATKPQPSTPALPAPAVPPAWSAGFEGGNFAEWTWWGQGQTSLWGHIAVVDPASEGVPRFGGARVGRFETTADDIAAGRTSAKVYESFRSNGRSPAHVGGTYRAWYYLPPSYRVPLNTDVNVFQFKEDYADAGGTWHSDALWWLNLSTASWAKGMGGAAWIGTPPARGDAPVFLLQHAENRWTRQVRFMPAPLGRWFEIRADLRQGDRIDFFIDGRLYDTARASEYPVNPFRSDSLGWTFGVGNYSTGANGPLYLDDASYTTAAG